MSNVQESPAASMRADQAIKVKALVVELRAVMKKHHPGPLHRETERQLETFVASLVQDMTDCSASTAVSAAKIFLAVSR